MTGVAECYAPVGDAYALYSSDVLRFAYEMVHESDLAEDIAANAWEMATRYWQGFNGMNILGWLRRITQNEARKYWEKDKPIASLDAFVLDRSPTTNYKVGSYNDGSKIAVHYPRSLITEDDLDLVVANLCPTSPAFVAFLSLPPRHREILNTKMNHPHDRDGAYALGIGYNAYRVRVSRARQRFRTALLACNTDVPSPIN